MLEGNIKNQPKVETETKIEDYLNSIKVNINEMQKRFESQDSTAATDAVGPKLYALTATYGCAKDIDIEKKILWIKRQHEMLYFHILESILPYYARGNRKHLQPIFYNFIDMPGTRKQHVDEIKAPHVHSLVIVHPKLVNTFEELIRRKFLKYGGMLNSKLKQTDKVGLQALKEQSQSIKFSEKPSKLNFAHKIHCEPLGESDYDIKRWVGYSAKFLDSNYAKYALDEDTRFELFDMLPKYRGLKLS